MIDETPDYPSYSLADLNDVKARVNREKFPDRYEKIVAEIEKRGHQPQEDKKTQVDPRTRNLYVGLLCVGFSSWMLLNEPIIPFWKMCQSQNWVKTQCVVSVSAYNPQKSNLIIRYKYEFKGMTWENDRFTFLPSTGYAGKKPLTTMKKYFVGKKMTCFVNPNKPQDSVLFRDNYPIIWVESVPLLFFFIGGWRLILKRNHLYLTEDGPDAKASE